LIYGKTSEAALILGVTVKTLQRWDHSGKALIIRTPNGQRRLQKSELNRLIGDVTNENDRKHLVT
jgi:putative resolvase